MQDISFYPIFSMIVFVVFFVGVLWYVKKMDTSEVDTLKNLPLEQ